MTQTVNTLIRLRELILNGELPPGERLVEVALVDLLGVSRTPIRAALVKLSEEGLLEQLPGGGYLVRAFTLADVHDAIQARGVIEGMAARLAAERGVDEVMLNKIKVVVVQIDELLGAANLSTEDISCYLDLNEQYHRHLISLAQSFVVERMVEHTVTLPFASANDFVIANSEIEQSWKIFYVAQDQHRRIVEAIANREGTRAEALAREHAHLALRTLNTVLKSDNVLETVPGARLIASVFGD
jgi:GntR family transcriptional regulator of vanillate catabolism